MASGNRYQFSVIARPRQGVPSSLSTYSIIMEIAKKLEPYKCICNVAFSSPNYVIHLPTLQLQLQILSVKQLAGPDLILDLIPYSPEYISCALPWIVASFNKGQHTAATERCGANSSNASVPSLQTASASSSVHQHTQATEGSPDSISSINSIVVPIPGGANSSAVVSDFSYYMVAELKQFYHDKFEAFQRCKETCREVHNVAHQFSDNIDAAIQRICDEADKYRHVSPQSLLSRLAAVSMYLSNEQWFISEEYFGLQFGMALLTEENDEHIDVTGYNAQNPDGQLIAPDIALPILKIIAEAVVLHIHGKVPLIKTEADYTDTLLTQIWCTDFHHVYKSASPATHDQAQADSIYRFLKHTTNVLGYTISDKNSAVLSALVSQINSFNGCLSDLQLHINKAAHMMQKVHTDIKEIQNEIPMNIWQKRLAHINGMFCDLLALLESYCAAATNGLRTFDQLKQTYRSITFETPYSSKPDDASTFMP